jgi:hypothetical protein
MIAGIVFDMGQFEHTGHHKSPVPGKLDALTALLDRYPG